MGCRHAAPRLLLRSSAHHGATRRSFRPSAYRLQSTKTPTTPRTENKSTTKQTRWRSSPVVCVARSLCLGAQVKVVNRRCAGEKMCDQVHSCLIRAAVHESLGRYHSEGRRCSHPRRRKAWRCCEYKPCTNARAGKHGQHANRRQKGQAERVDADA